MIRVDGDVRRINVPSLEHKQVHDLVYDIMNDKQRKDYEEFLETDFSFEVPGSHGFGLTRLIINVALARFFEPFPQRSSHSRTSRHPPSSKRFRIFPVGWCW